MTEQEKNLLDFFSGHIQIMTVDLDPSTNEWNMKPMKGANEALVKHFTHDEINCSEDNVHP